MDGPLHFESYLRTMVWGGRRLAEVLGKRLPSDEPYGESWEVSGCGAVRDVPAVGEIA